METKYKAEKQNEWFWGVSPQLELADSLQAQPQLKL